MTSHYDVMGVAQHASPEEIKRAYHRKARAFHPDAHAGSTMPVLHEAAHAMAALNAAWNVLRDPKLREEYDDALHRAELETSRRGGRRPPRARRSRTAPPLMIGGGIRYWMGTTGSPLLNEEGESRFNLSVHGDTDLAPLRRLAPNRLWGLHCERSNVDDAQLANLQGMRGLRLLDLSGTRVTDAGMVHLQDLQRLETLAVWDTAITDAGMPLIGRLQNLRHIGLGRTAITDAGLAALSPLVEMRLLQLWGTDVRGSGLAHLHGLTQLEIVTLPRRVSARHRRRLRRALPDTLIE